tara:strand:+ start:67 stop:519 length:453 start_codon:yes stop_codon:yes gene_type:complete
MVVIPMYPKFFKILTKEVENKENWRRLLSSLGPDIYINPLNYLVKISRAHDKDFITDNEYKAIFRRCIRRYWRIILSGRSRGISAQWDKFYTKYKEDRDRNIAFEKYGEEFIRTYINKQKFEFAQSCSKLVFDGGLQIPESVESNIINYI